MNGYVEAFRKYATVAGRSRRKEYWSFSLMNVVVSLFLGVTLGVVGVMYKQPLVSLGSWIYVLAILVPSITVTTRRLHDTGRSGWWQLIAFLPLIGAIVLLVFLVQDGQPGPNRFGPNPKSLGSPAPMRPARA